MIALASDFDNTIYFADRNSKIRQEDIEAIRDFQVAGNLFGLCTGRPFGDILKFLNPYVQSDFYIGSSGAHVLDKRGTCIYERYLDKSLAFDLLEYGRQLGYTALVQVEGQIYAYKTDRFRSMGQISSLRDIHNRINAVSFLTGQDAFAVALQEEINSRFQGYAAAFANKGSVDVVHAECSKGKAIRILKKEMGLDLICGIGDGENDYDLLQAADISFTFEYASTRMQEAATQVVKSEKDAIGYLLAFRKNH